MLLKLFKNLATRVLSGLKPLGCVSWFYILIKHCCSCFKHYITSVLAGTILPPRAFTVKPHQYLCKLTWYKTFSPVLLILALNLTYSHCEDFPASLLCLADGVSCTISPIRCTTFSSLLVNVSEAVRYHFPDSLR